VAAQTLEQLLLGFLVVWQQGTGYCNADFKWGGGAARCVGCPGIYGSEDNFVVCGLLLHQYGEFAGILNSCSKTPLKKLLHQCMSSCTACDTLHARNKLWHNLVST
jgi:hypothetical protein